MDYGALPPEINSGRMEAGIGSGPLLASAAAWQGLSAQLESAGAAFSAVVTALTAGSWMGPSSITMAAAAAPYVVWMIATSMQCQEAAVAAEQAAAAFDAARFGIIPVAVIEENRARLATLIATNFMGINTPAIAATEAQYDGYWAHDAATMYGFAGDASTVTGSLVPFLPPDPATNPAGLGAQAAAVGQAAAEPAGQQSTQVAKAVSQLGGLPGGFDAQSMLTMGPQLITTLPQTLQGLASPLTSGLGSPMSGLGQFQSLLTPFLGALNNPGLMGAGTSGLAGVGEATLPGISGISGGLGGAGGLGAAGSGVEAVAARGVSLGGLSVPATWTAGASQAATTSAATALPGPAAGSAVPATTGGAGMYGPMAGMAGRGSGSSDGPRYGTPVKITRR